MAISSEQKSSVVFRVPNFVDSDGIEYTEIEVIVEMDSDIRSANLAETLQHPVKANANDLSEYLRSVAICECGERVTMTRDMLRGFAVECHSIRSGFAGDLRNMILANKGGQNAAKPNKVDVLESILC